MNGIASLYSQIEQIAQSLRQAGKTPSLALIRARLGPGVNGAELMTTYQRWHSTQGSLSSAAVSELQVTAAENIQQISVADFQRLEAKIDLLLQLFQQLQNAAPAATKD